MRVYQWEDTSWDPLGADIDGEAAATIRATRCRFPGTTRQCSAPASLRAPVSHICPYLTDDIAYQRFRYLSALTAMFRK